MTCAPQDSGWVCADGEGAVNSEKGLGETESPEETWVGLASFGAVGVTGGTE